MTGEADPAALQQHQLDRRGGGIRSAAAGASAGGAGGAEQQQAAERDDAAEEHPRGPHPCIPPEAVVAAQLAALKWVWACGVAGKHTRGMGRHCSSGCVKDTV